MPLLHNLCICLFMLHDFYHAMYLEWYGTCATATLVLYLELLCHSMLMLHDVIMTYSLYSSSHVSLVSLLYLYCACWTTASTCYMAPIMLCLECYFTCATDTYIIPLLHRMHHVLVTSYSFHDLHTISCMITLMRHLSMTTTMWHRRIPTKYYIVPLMHDY